ncbi:MAG: ShlB/FhaC/HecB family hemolysin secretion/activation protein [Candidatus Thiodiazotropha sp.]
MVRGFNETRISGRSGWRWRNSCHSRSPPNTSKSRMQISEDSSSMRTKRFWH